GRIRSPGRRALRAVAESSGGKPETREAARPQSFLGKAPATRSKTLAFAGGIRSALPGSARLAAQSAPGENGNGRSQPASRDFDREKIYQPRPLVPRSYPGRQHGPDESRGKI